MITMWKNICPYIFSFILSRIETSDQYYQNISFLYTNHKSQNGKFLWLDNTYFFFFSFLLFFFIYGFKNQNGKFLCLDKTFISCYLALFYGFKNQNDKFPWLNKNFVFGSSTSFLTSKPKSLCLDIWSLFLCLVYGYKIGNRNFLWDLIKTLSLDLLLCLWLQNQNHKLLWLDKTLFLVFFYGFNFEQGKLL